MEVEHLYSKPAPPVFFYSLSRHRRGRDTFLSRSLSIFSFETYVGLDVCGMKVDICTLQSECKP